MRRRRFEYEAANCAAARLILLNSTRYGGDAALLVRWARATLARTQESGPGASGQLDLFDRAEVAGGGEAAG
jgi:hypothetical protein